MASHRHFVSVLLTIILCVRCFFTSGRIENVALNKSCSMSSQYDASSGCEGAVNGNTTGVYKINGTNCIHTNGSYKYSWWEVNLGRPYPVHSIIVWARSGSSNQPIDQYIRRMVGVEISVDGNECYTFNTIPAQRNITITCTNGVLTGTVIRVSKNATEQQIKDRDHSINMCEFQVLTCDDGHWDIDCRGKCGNCSNSEVCDKVTGHCSSCSPGLKPPLCYAACDDGHWDIDCRGKCGNCSNSEVCDKVTGHCSSCSPGLKPPLCYAGCSDGHWGIDCSEKCDNCSNSEVCDKVTGNCSICSPELRTPLCNAAKKAELREAGDASKTWMIVGASLGGVALLAIIVTVVVVCVRCQRSRAKTPTDPGKVPRKRDTAAAKSERPVKMHHPQTKQSEEADDCSVTIPGSIYDQLHTSPDTGDQHLYSDLQTVHKSN